MLQVTHDDHQTSSQSPLGERTEDVYTRPHPTLEPFSRMRQIGAHRNKWVCRQVHSGNRSTSRRPFHILLRSVKVLHQPAQHHACSSCKMWQIFWDSSLLELPCSRYFHQKRNVPGDTSCEREPLRRLCPTILVDQERSRTVPTNT